MYKIIDFYDTVQAFVIVNEVGEWVETYPSAALAENFCIENEVPYTFMTETDFAYENSTRKQ